MDVDIREVVSWGNVGTVGRGGNWKNGSWNGDAWIDNDNNDNNDNDLLISSFILINETLFNNS